MMFPQKIGKCELIEFNGENADYREEQGFGFYQKKTIRTVWPDHLPNKKVVRVRHLACNSWGKGTCLIVNEAWFLSLQDALNNLQGIKVKPKPPKRKLIVQPSATIEELNNYIGEEMFAIRDENRG